MKSDYQEHEMSAVHGHCFEIERNVKTGRFKL